VLAVLAACLLLVSSVHGAGSSLTIILPEVQRQALVGQYSHSVHQFHSLHVASQQINVLIVNFSRIGEFTSIYLILTKMFDKCKLTFIITSRNYAHHNMLYRLFVCPYVAT